MDNRSIKPKKSKKEKQQLSCDMSNNDVIADYGILSKAQVDYKGPYIFLNC